MAEVEVCGGEGVGWHCSDCRSLHNCSGFLSHVDAMPLQGNPNNTDKTCTSAQPD